MAESGKPTIVDQGVVYAPGSNSPSQSCCFPGVAASDAGRWICTFRAAPTKTSTVDQQVLLTWSDDAGQSWIEPFAPFAPPRIADRSGEFRAGYVTAVDSMQMIASLCWLDVSEPALPLYNEATEGVLDMKLMLSTSEDGGATWSTPWQIDTTPYDGPTPLTGPLLELGEGEFALQFELNKTYKDPSPWRHASVLLISNDGGRTWPVHVRVSDDPNRRIFYWDQRPAVLGDGRILDLFWVFDREKQAYLNIHARLSGRSPTHWSGIWDTGVSGQPAAPVSLPGGQLGMVFVDRTTSPVIKMRTSPDEGRTWPEESETIVYETDLTRQASLTSDMSKAWSEMQTFSLGLPATTVLPDGDLLVVFYAGSHPDHTAIRWARLRA